MTVTAYWTRQFARPHSKRGDVNETRRIVCATDLARPATAAFRHALALADIEAAHVDLVYAVPPTRRFGWNARQRLKHLAELRREATDARVPLKVTVHHGEPADVVRRHAALSRGSRPELIVIGAPPPRPQRFRLRSIADAVVHQATVPTMVVPDVETVDAPATPPFRGVVCAVDLSPASLPAVDIGVRMLHRGAERLRLLHVVNTSGPMRRAPWNAERDDVSGAIEGAKRQLLRLVPLQPELRDRIDVEVVAGDVVDEIVRSASAAGADLVIVGIRPLGWFRRLWGSTAGRVLDRLRAPVLTVPASTENRLGARASRAAVA
jgi:nucleotide-binding universal stress UspA family protein